VIGEPSTYAYAGATSNLLKAGRLDAGAGAYLLTGQSAQELLSRVLASDPAAYGITGATVDFLKDAVINASSGLYVIAGQDSMLTWLPPFVVPIVIRIDGRKFIHDLDKRLKISRLEVSPKILDVDKRR
jgi:RNase P/RNase MRP subunit p29